MERGKLLLLISLMLLFAMPFNAESGCTGCNIPSDNSSANLPDSLNSSFGIFNTSDGNAPLLTESSLIKNPEPGIWTEKHGRLQATLLHACATMEGDLDGNDI